MRRSGRVHYEAAEAYELVLAIASSVSATLSGSGTAVGRAALADPLAQRARAVIPSDWMWAHLVGVATLAPSPRDVGAFLSYLDRLPGTTLLRHLLGYHVDWFRRLTPSEVVLRAVRGDRFAIRSFLEGTWEDDAWRTAARACLEAGPRRTKMDVLEVLASWAEERSGAIQSAARQSERTASRWRREARRHEAQLSDEDPSESPGDLLVIPSRSLVNVRHEFNVDRVRIVCVPLPRRPATGHRPELAGALSALADRSRMGIVARLHRRRALAQELSEDLDRGLPTVLHHLERLRAAGIVAGGGRGQAYYLRPGSLRAVGEQLLLMAGHHQEYGASLASSPARRSRGRPWPVTFDE